MSDLKNYTTEVKSLDFITFGYDDFYAFEDELTFEVAMAGNPELFSKYVSANKIEFVSAKWYRHFKEVYITYSYECDDCHEKGEVIHRQECTDRFDYKVFSADLYKTVAVR